MIDRLLQIISGIMLVLCIYGVGIIDNAQGLGFTLIIGCLTWFGLLTVVANRPERRRKVDRH